MGQGGVNYIGGGGGGGGGECCGGYNGKNPNFVVEDSFLARDVMVTIKFDQLIKTSN